MTILKPGEVKDPPGLPILGNSIVLGKITTGDAYLNDGRTGVFSEYLINVTEVLKSDPTSVVSAGDEISAWRMGGSLKITQAISSIFWLPASDFQRLVRTISFFF
ncbi:MAG TPA: hypothetical protein VLB68_28555, partial [Pyrinomonadaceae bacterium]|nr:hypothetical protein [Pyrinomonadaceae bacterium]